MAEPFTTTDPTTPDAGDLTRAVESNVADVIALKGRVGESSYEREMEALPFIGELSRDCDRCQGFGSVKLSTDQQAHWKAHLAELRLELAKVPGDKNHDDVRKKAGEALRDGVAGYQKACRCSGCEGFGKTLAPGLTRQRVPCGGCGGSGVRLDGESCGKCLGSGSASLGIPDSVWNTISCWRCRGSGEVPDEDAQDVCPVCDGEGCTVPVTVRETGSSKK